MSWIGELFGQVLKSEGFWYALLAACALIVAIKLPTILKVFADYRVSMRKSANQHELAMTKHADKVRLKRDKALKHANEHKKLKEGRSR